MSPLAIAGIGSRETPADILAEMILVGQWCRVNGVEVRSGHAPGADRAFESGAMQSCVAYLPWSSFEARANALGGRLVTPDNWMELMAHAKQFHPSWDRLKDSVRKLMARNSAQVLGLDLKSPIQAVVCWTDGGGSTGGTGQALRIAAANNIPIFNMYFEQFSTAELVNEHLKKIFIEYLKSRLSAGI